MGRLITAVEKCDLVIGTQTKDDYKPGELARVSWKSSFERDLEE